MKTVTIYTDGACSGNPGPGGYGLILEYKTTRKEFGGYAEHTTNSKMELTAVLDGLERLKEPCEVNVVTDSNYVCTVISGIDAWTKVKDGTTEFRTRSGAKCANPDLLQRFVNARNKGHVIRYQWVKGHDGHPENERCDAIARAQIQSRQILSSGSK